MGEKVFTLQNVQGMIYTSDWSFSKRFSICITLPVKRECMNQNE